MHIPILLYIYACETDIGDLWMKWIILNEWYESVCMCVCCDGWFKGPVNRIILIIMNVGLWCWWPSTVHHCIRCVCMCRWTLLSISHWPRTRVLAHSPAWHVLDITLHKYNDPWLWDSILMMMRWFRQRGRERAWNKKKWYLLIQTHISSANERIGVTSPYQNSSSNNNNHNYIVSKCWLIAKLHLISKNVRRADSNSLHIVSLYVYWMYIT